MSGDHQRKENIEGSMKMPYTEENVLRVVRSMLRNSNYIARVWRTEGDENLENQELMFGAALQKVIMLMTSEEYFRESVELYCKGETND